MYWNKHEKNITQSEETKLINYILKDKEIGSRAYNNLKSDHTFGLACKEMRKIV